VYLGCLAPVFTYSLINKNVPTVTIRFLVNLYLFQVTRVAWNGSYSSDIKIPNGVRKGAVLSPVLFCIYSDELIHAVESAKYGCYNGLFRCCSCIFGATGT